MLVVLIQQPAFGFLFAAGVTQKSTQNHEGLDAKNFTKKTHQGMVKFKLRKPSKHFLLGNLWHFGRFPSKSKNKTYHEHGHIPKTPKMFTPPLACFVFFC